MNFKVQKLLAVRKQLNLTIEQIRKDSSYKKVHLIADNELENLLKELQAKLGVEAIQKINLLSPSVDIGDEDQVWELLDMATYIADLHATLQTSIESVLASAFALGASSLVNKLPGVTFDAKSQTISAKINGQDTTLNYSFNMRNPLVQTYIKNSAGALTKDISDDAKLAIKRVLSNAFEYGGSPKEQAEALKQFIGLTPKMQEQVDKYRKALEAHGLLQDEVSKLVAEMTEKKLQERCENIARTETINAANAGLKLAWQQAQHDGLLNENWVETWVVTPDDRLCPFCSAMSGKQIPIGGKFSSSMDGSKISGPGLHSRCRCTVMLTEKTAEEGK